VGIIHDPELVCGQLLPDLLRKARTDQEELIAVTYLVGKGLGCQGQSKIHRLNKK
jgi:hypothetical protein